MFDMRKQTKTNWFVKLKFCTHLKIGSQITFPFDSDHGPHRDCDFIDLCGASVSSQNAAHDARILERPEKCGVDRCHYGMITQRGV